MPHHAEVYVISIDMQCYDSVAREDILWLSYPCYSEDMGKDNRHVFCSMTREEHSPACSWYLVEIVIRESREYALNQMMPQDEPLQTNLLNQLVVPGDGSPAVLLGSVGRASLIAALGPDS